jgi:GST-like protein
VPVLEWLMWQIGGFGPMPHPLSHFLTVENEADRRYGIGRYSKETRRLYGCSTSDSARSNSPAATSPS